MKRSIHSLLTAFALSMTAAPSLAAVPTYLGSGENPASYTFTATSSDIVAYFAGGSAGQNNTLGLRVNGVDMLSNLTSNVSSYGSSYAFSGITVGDTLTFFIAVNGNTPTFFSDKLLNADDLNHVYSTSFAGEGAVPAGTFVSFEDLEGGGDFDYNDIGFVFTNVVGAAPEPATWAMMIGGFGMAGGALRRRRDRAGLATA